MKGDWIENAVSDPARGPDTPFADLGPALKRLLALGADARDLSLVARHASFEAVFQVLYLRMTLAWTATTTRMMHEELLMADPSALEGRPGSA